jgi:hypothetical protein
MEKWTIVAYVVVSGLGALVFLLICSRELMLRKHMLHLRIEAERERKAKLAREAAERRTAEVEEEVVSVAAPSPSPRAAPDRAPAPTA